MPKTIDTAYWGRRYADDLMKDTMPFWFPRCIDEVHGGYLLMRARDGSLIDDDKSVWFLGRTAWMCATIYNTVERDGKWLDYARTGIEFMRKHAYDADGRMFFHLTRDGKPIRKRRYYFSETFACIALAAYAKASGEKCAEEESRKLFRICMEYAQGKRTVEPKFTDERPGKAIGAPMILLNTAMQLRDNLGECPEFSAAIDWCINEIERDFVKHDLRVVMESVAPDGSVIDHVDGRTLNPGHAIEGAWFILEESRHRGNDPRLTKLGCQMLDYMWERGWDKEHGGLLYFTGLDSRPVQEYWHDMKFWWPQCEGIIATLLAWKLTGDPKYAGWHEDLDAWTRKHHHDPVHGDWYGYLHRDGSIANGSKGNLFKGPFHLPRMQWYCANLLGAFDGRKA